MQISPARPEDAAMLSEIAFAAKRHWDYPDEWMESWRSALTIRPEFIADNETYAAVVDGQVAGFYALGRGNDRLELLHLWVLPNSMGQGIGRSLFHHAVERAQALGFRELEIESDPNAEGFYERLGARRIAVRPSAVEPHQRQLPVLIYRIDPTPCAKSNCYPLERIVAPKGVLPVGLLFLVCDVIGL